jgi:hypothetical protein
MGDSNKRTRFTEQEREVISLGLDTINKLGFYPKSEKSGSQFITKLSDLKSYLKNQEKDMHFSRINDVFLGIKERLSIAAIDFESLSGSIIADQPEDLYKSISPENKNKIIKICDHISGLIFHARNDLDYGDEQKYRVEVIQNEIRELAGLKPNKAIAVKPPASEEIKTSPDKPPRTSLQPEKRSEYSPSEKPISDVRRLAEEAVAKKLAMRREQIKKDPWSRD